GFPDLAVASTYPSDVTILLGNGNGEFRFSGDAQVGSPLGLVAGDFNADGRLDLAVASSTYPDYTATVSILLGDGFGGMIPADSIVLEGARFFDVVSMIVADFNADGATDIVFRTNGANTVGLLLSDGLGGFVRAEDAFAPWAYAAIAAGDFDSDG